MPELRIMDTQALPFTHETRYPGVSFRVIESQATHPTISLIIAQVEVGSLIQRHTHPTETETAYILSGSAVLIVDNAEHALMLGMVVTIPPGTPHSVRNSGDIPLQIIAIHTPPTR